VDRALFPSTYSSPCPLTLPAHPPAPLPSWCAPCRAIAPTYTALAASHSSISFVTLDIDGCPELAATLHLTSLPTFKAFHQGQEVASLVGGEPSKLVAMVEQARPIGTPPLHAPMGPHPSTPPWDPTPPRPMGPHPSTPPWDPTPPRPHGTPPLYDRACTPIHAPEPGSLPLTSL
jgi:thiol-disulfide isomerase/thioredoxin